MNTHSDKARENKSQAAANSNSKQQIPLDAELQQSEQSDNSSRLLQAAANGSPQVKQLKAYQAMANEGRNLRQLEAVRPNLNTISATAQLAEAKGLETLSRTETGKNTTGMPDNLKSGIENLSGFSMNDVKVHYNSDKPAQLEAHAYAQGNEIHLASGQERHLPHEAWHVVQQKQNRVQATRQMKGEMPVNDDEALEKEADEMGQTALSRYAGPAVGEPLAPPATLSKTPVQRKIRDLPIAGLEAILGPLTARFTNYNLGQVVDGLDPGPKLEQIEKDKKFLDFFTGQLMEKAGTLDAPNAKLTELIAEMEKQSTELLERKRAVTALSSKKPRVIAPIAFNAFPALIQPVNNGSVMGATTFLEATINGQPYRLYAGQNYLNLEYSQSLWTTAPTKAGNILIYEGGERYPDEPGFKCAVIGDAHHRFIWGAKHGQTLTAELVPQPFAEKIYAWSELTYKHNPKHEYTFNVDERQDPLKANANDSVKKKLFLAMVSPLAPYAGAYPSDPGKFVDTHLATFWTQIQKGFVIEGTERQLILSHLSGLYAKALVKSYPEAVKALVEGAADKKMAASMGKILVEAFPSGRMPNVAFGDTPSVGYYDPDFHVIVIDPAKNASPDAKLDTLAFETGNALQRKDFLDKKETTTSVEFRTMQGYIDTLIEATGSGGINTLVMKLKIPNKFLVEEKAKDVLSKDPPALTMPDEGELPDQKQRSALAWFKMQEWAEPERMQYFATSAHAKGMAATGAEYKDKASVEKAEKDGPEVKPANPAKDVMSQTVVAINKAYPGASDWHWQKLQARQFGEFILTGAIVAWSGDPDKVTKYDQSLVNALVRDVEKVYPNAQQMHWSEITYTDVGEFLFEGKIKSWETWGQVWDGKE